MLHIVITPVAGKDTMIALFHQDAIISGLTHFRGMAQVIGQDVPGGGSQVYVRPVGEDVVLLEDIANAVHGQIDAIPELLNHTFGDTVPKAVCRRGRPLETDGGYGCTHLRVRILVLSTHKVELLYGAVVHLPEMNEGDVQCSRTEIHRYAESGYTDPLITVSRVEIADRGDTLCHFDPDVPSSDQSDIGGHADRIAAGDRVFTLFNADHSTGGGECIHCGGDVRIIPTRT
jgi:hypothetical protein